MEETLDAIMALVLSFAVVMTSVFGAANFLEPTGLDGQLETESTSIVISALGADSYDNDSPPSTGDSELHWNREAPMSGAPCVCISRPARKSLEILFFAPKNSPPGASA